ncbi:MAG: hypothetical protein DHS20C02_05680 [Micavibrio sp.]|nr:MAG: hypothetical protein DHS20C02_05680 [Micavibrio sp.]
MTQLAKEKISYTSNFDYHLRQYKTPYRSTVSLIEYLKSNIDTSKVKRVLDLGCGGGANIHWLKEAFPDWDFVGVDFDPKAVEVAQEQNPTEQFFCEDVLNMKDAIAGKPFDLVLCIQVVLTAPFSLYEFLDATLSLAEKNLILTSLFSEEYFEQDTTRRDLQKGTSYVYKIDSLKRLEDYIADKGVELSSEFTEIDVDLPKPEPLTLSTYTIKTDEGKRVQVSPYMLMPWYTVNLTKK